MVKGARTTYRRADHLDVTSPPGLMKAFFLAIVTISVVYTCFDLAITEFPQILGNTFRILRREY